MRGAIDQYIEDVVKKIRAKEMRSEIRDELYDHLMTRVEEDMRNGISRETAEADAVKQMGEPQETARRLNQVHKYHWPWTLWLLIGAWMGLAIAGLYIVQLNDSSQMFDGIVIKHSIFTLMGIIVFAAVCCIDYRKLLNKGHWIFAVMMGLILFAQWQGVQVNGSRYFLDVGVFFIDVISYSPFFFLLGIYLWLYSVRKQDTARSKRMEWVILLVSMTPLYVYLTLPRVYCLTLYGLGLLLIYCKWIRLSWPKLISFAGIGLTGCLFMILSPNGTERLMVWLSNLGVYAGQGEDYILQRILSTIQHAGWWGHGVSSPLDLPYLYTDNLIVLIIHTFGWLGGLFIFIIFGLLIAQLFRLAGSVQDQIGRGIMILGVTFMVLYTAIYVLGLFNLLPVNEGGLPLLSYGGSGILAWMTILGLYCNVYIRKDRVSAYAV